MHPTDGYLYTAHNGTSSVNDWPVYVYDIATAIASVADGGALPEVRRHQTPSQYPEDLTWHPVTGECWIATEGYDAVDDYDPFMAAWRSPLVADEPVWQEVLIDYDGAGEFTFTLDGQFFGTSPATPSEAPDRIAIGAFPASTAGWLEGFFVGVVKNVAFKDKPFSAAELVKLRAGTYEPLTLTEYTVPVVNPGAETGDLTGWTVTSGAGGIAHIRPDPALQAGSREHPRILRRQSGRHGPHAAVQHRHGHRPDHNRDRRPDRGREFVGDRRLVELELQRP